MSESLEQPKKYPIYPTMKDALELQRIADTKATGANIHRAKDELNTIFLYIGNAEKYGWNEELLIKVNSAKTKLFEILSGAS